MTLPPAGAAARAPERPWIPAVEPVAGPDGAPAFFLARTPVVCREYASFLAAGRAVAPPWWNDPRFGAPENPVVGVTWTEAREYAAWLSEITGAGFRLPSEDEWERAACGGLVRPKTAWGDTIPEGEIPDGPLDGPWEAGRGTPNAFGLCDMGTIVHEWCANWADDGRVPRRRASRGGSWRHRIRWSPPEARSSLPPDFRYSDYGFRVLREVGR